MLRLLLRLSSTIDRFTGRLGRTALADAGDGPRCRCERSAPHAGRFVGMNLTSNATIEAQWYLFSIVFLLGATVAVQQDAHVRVDVFYGRLTARGRAIIDLAGGLLLLIPFGLVRFLGVRSERPRERGGLGGLPRPGRPAPLAIRASCSSASIAHGTGRVRGRQASCLPGRRGSDRTRPAPMRRPRESADVGPAHVRGRPRTGIHRVPGRVLAGRNGTLFAGIGVHLGYFD